MKRTDPSPRASLPVFDVEQPDRFSRGLAANQPTFEGPHIRMSNSKAARIGQAVAEVLLIVLAVPLIGTVLARIVVRIWGAS